jgi:serine/threonine protein kinase
MALPCEEVIMQSVQDEVAIKLFTNTTGFAAEQAVYSHSSLADVVGKPPLFVSNTDRIACTSYGFVFPPFTVMERGQPLSERISDFSADCVTSMQVALTPRLLQPVGWAGTRKHDKTPVQVLGQALNAVKALHEAGFAHRNIKPSNILRRLRQHDWVLFDFASSAPLSALPF